ncbi:unnamed protein product, partial [Allacma fusca]
MSGLVTILAIFCLTISPSISRPLNLVAVKGLLSHDQILA